MAGYQSRYLPILARGSGKGVEKYEQYVKEGVIPWEETGISGRRVNTEFGGMVAGAILEKEGVQSSLGCESLRRRRIYTKALV